MLKDNDRAICTICENLKKKHSGVSSRIIDKNNVLVFLRSGSLRGCCKVPLGQEVVIVWIGSKLMTELSFEC